MNRLFASLFNLWIEHAPRAVKAFGVVVLLALASILWSAQ